MAEHTEWVADGVNIFYKSALIVRCGDSQLAAHIVREHNSHDALVKALYEECHHCTGDENEYPDICGKCGTGAALALAEVKP